MTNTSPSFEPVRIGTSPSGVEWIAYRAASVEPMRERLAVLAARHAARKVRRVEITRAQCDILEDILQARADSGEPAIVNLRRTFVEGRASELADLAGVIDPSELATFAEGSAMTAHTAAQLAFCWRSAFAGARLLVARLEGVRMTLASARKVAKFERPF